MSDFLWNRIGRAYVVRFGRLSVAVRCRGSHAKGTSRWVVDNVFGNPFLGSGRAYTRPEDAMAEAAPIARREVRILARRFGYVAAPPGTEETKPVKLTVIIANIVDAANAGGPVTYRRVTFNLTPEQEAKLARDEKWETYGVTFIEPAAPPGTTTSDATKGE